MIRSRKFVYDIINIDSIIIIEHFIVYDIGIRYRIHITNQCDDLVMSIVYMMPSIFIYLYGLLQ